jgi:KDEL-tailed cysteine endopeptidase
MLRALLLAAAAAAAAAASASTSPSFPEWAAQHGRVYATAAESAFRARVYAANALAIDAHNRASDSSGGWRMGTNGFSDLTADEFKARMTGGYAPTTRSSFRDPHRSLFAASPDAPPPTNVDWTQKGAVTPVKNQGGCGSCWAFSATGAMEAAWFFYNKTLRSFSEQQLIDCSGEGCGGGSFQHAWGWAIKNKGLCAEKSYPYKAKDGKCERTCAIEGRITKVHEVVHESEDDLLAAIAGRPVSVAVEADQSVFQHYRSGVMDGACGTKLDHAVLAVGYGVESNKSFYLMHVRKTNNTRTTPPSNPYL